MRKRVILAVLDADVNATYSISTAMKYSFFLLNCRGSCGPSSTRVYLCDTVLHRIQSTWFTFSVLAADAVLPVGGVNVLEQV